MVAIQDKLESDIALEDTEFGRDRELATSKAKALVNSLSQDDRIAFSQELIAGCAEIQEDQATLSSIRFDNTDELLASSFAPLMGSNHPTEDLTESRHDSDSSDTEWHRVTLLLGVLGWAVSGAAGIEKHVNSQNRGALSY